MASGEGDEETVGNEPEVDMREVFQKKYFALKKMCDQVQQTNEKLVNRIHQMKRMIKKFKQERGLLVTKLDNHDDEYSEAQVPAMWEEGPSAELEPTAVPNGTEMDVEVKPKPDPEPLLPEAMQPVPTATGPVVGLPPTPSTSASSSTATTPGGTHKPTSRTATGFLLFCQHRRHEIQEKFSEEEDREMPQHDLVKALTNQWTSLPTEKKRVYQDLAASLTAAPPSSSAMQALQESSPSTASLLQMQ